MWINTEFVYYLSDLISVGNRPALNNLQLPWQGTAYDEYHVMEYYNIHNIICVMFREDVMLTLLTIDEFLLISNKIN